MVEEATSHLRRIFSILWSLDAAKWIMTVPEDCNFWFGRLLKGEYEVDQSSVACGNVLQGQALGFCRKVNMVSLWRSRRKTIQRYVQTLWFLYYSRLKKPENIIQHTPYGPGGWKGYKTLVFYHFVCCVVMSLETSAVVPLGWSNPAVCEHGLWT